MRLLNKTAVVTGAMQGIGAGISLVLAQHGAKVVLIDVSPKVKDTCKILQKENLKAEYMIMDVTKSQQVNTVIKTILDSHSKIDILVNNAGVYPRLRLVEMEEKFLKRMFEINVFGMFRCAKAVVPNMMENRKGKIINISSVTGPLVGSPSGGQTAYAASKAAVIGFTKALALEVAQYNINVNAILPGYIYSPSAFRLRGSQSEEDTEESMLEFGYTIPMGRQGTPKDIGNLVLFLGSEESNYFTGSEIIIDGGNILQEEYLGPYKPK